jgi:hypothetical protein
MGRMPQTQYEAGLTTDQYGYVHAAARKLVGNRTLCTGQRVVVLVAGRFDPDDRLACPVCAKRVSD